MRKNLQCQSNLLNFILSRRLHIKSCLQIGSRTPSLLFSDGSMSSVGPSQELIITQISQEALTAQQGNLKLMQPR